MPIGKSNLEQYSSKKTRDFERGVAGDKYRAEKMLAEHKAFAVDDKINGTRKIYSNEDNSLLYFEDVKEPRRPDDVYSVYKEEKEH